MEWFYHDPERGEETKWWSIDPQTGQPSDVGGSIHCLGESPIEEVGMAADAIDTVFGASRFWSDEEVRALLLQRAVPARIRHPSDADELLDLVDGLWKSVDICYERALRRSPSQAERHWLFSYAFGLLRPSRG
jgi:hypothetical protein